jgi:hypothetical protein
LNYRAVNIGAEQPENDREVFVSLNEVRGECYICSKPPPVEEGFLDVAADVFSLEGDE